MSALDDRVAALGVPPADDASLHAVARDLVAAATEAGVTLGTAESLTGGLVAATMTGVPGSSVPVLGGVVSYSPLVKRDVLGVSRGTLAGPGVVSEECAREMAAGARRVLGCDVSVAVTGIAGPGGAEPGKPVGTVWTAVATPASCAARLLHLAGDRDQVRRSTCAFALALLRAGVMEA